MVGVETRHMQAVLKAADQQEKKRTAMMRAAARR